MKKDYYLGLDIGTNSVGWAATDENYNLCRFRGKDMWGIHLFDQAETAADRRLSRTNRRRLKRRNQRIKLLQELFAEEVYKVDPEFFIRLNESRLIGEDKSVKAKHPLFSDADYTDIEYYDEYPTIYHLRSELIHGTKPKDVRFLYLAVHHILKNRGHFLVAGELDAATDFNATLETMINTFNDNMSFKIEAPDHHKLEMCLRNKTDARSVMAKKACAEIHVSEIEEMEKKDARDCENAVKVIGNLLAGNQGDLKRLFFDRTLDIDESFLKVKFSESKYEEEIEPALESQMPEELYILSAIKALYDWRILVDILAGKEYFSDAKVQTYNTHKNNLLILHAMMKKYCPKAEYKEFFDGTDAKKANYSNYIGHVDRGSKTQTVKKCSEDDFYKNLEKILADIEKNAEEADLPIVERLHAETLSRTLLPLQRSKDNGVVPMQVHKKELAAILSNAENYYPFLKEKDGNGVTVSEKILSIHSYRIPYYVGPLSKRHQEEGANVWVERKEKGYIYPWNFDEKVDREKSNERFIKRMTNKCTYLVGEDVLPKQSLLYSKYMVLNELNNLTIRGKAVSVELKKAIYHDLFEKTPKVTGRKLLVYLQKDDAELVKEDLGGFDQDFKASLSTYIAFRDKVFGEQIGEDHIAQLIEDIIKWGTIYGDDSRMLLSMVNKVYPGELSEKQQSEIRKMRFSGWGNFSRKFLDGVKGTNREDGVIDTIIGALWDTNNNLMQLLSGRFTFLEEVKKMNQQSESQMKDVSYDELVKELYTSPANKRAIWRTVQIVDEVCKVMGCPPKKVFVEMARGGEKEKTRKASKKQKLLDLYAACEKDTRDWIKEIEDRDEREFNSKKLYLYYTQMGKCAYTGHEIDLDELMRGSSKWDRDHIYPQSKIKDDSFDNLVLVEREVNAKKSNDMIDAETQRRMRGTWKMWLDKGLISKTKYDRLTRKDDFTVDELSGFISRQLVETRQSTKLVAELLERLYPESKIVRVKAGLVSDFRHSPLNVLKSRRVNDFHHAVDAYLNVVVGNVYNTRFTSNPVEWVRKNRDDEEWSINRVFYYDVPGAWKAPDPVKGYDGKWHAKRNDDGDVITGTIDIVRRTARKNSVLYTEYTYCDSGELFNATLQPASDKNLIPLKKGLDTKKYGGYTSANTSYFALIEFDGKKGERIRNIIGVPIYVANMLKHDTDALKWYCEAICGKKNPEVLCNRINKNALMNVDGYPMRIRGENELQLMFKNALQLWLPVNSIRTVKSIEKWVESSPRYEIEEGTDQLSNNDLDELYSVLMEKMNSVYANRPGNQSKAMEKGKSTFLTLSLEDKSLLLNSLINQFRCDNDNKSDLRLIGGTANAGNMTKSKNFIDTSVVYLINQSVTGLFENSIRL